MSTRSYLSVGLPVIVWLAMLALLLSACEPAPETATRPAQEPHPRHRVRVATFNVAMGLSSPGELANALRQQTNPKLLKLAEILQRVRPDIVLLNEFDYDPAIDAATLLNRNYLSRGQNNQEPIDFEYQFRAPVNSGVDSGLDLNDNGVLHEPADAWGFGSFPGQYGMLVLSRFPINADRTRTFQRFLWSDLPGARKPLRADGASSYPDAVWQRLRLSSKSHWDVLIRVNDRRLHLLAFHPTPPVFDGPDDRNGLRNFDEIRFWVKYLAAEPKLYLVDDQGHSGGIPPYQAFVIAGDFNADPVDGDSVQGAAAQLLDLPRFNRDCTPTSEGGRIASEQQAGINKAQRGDPAGDTSDFNDETTGNLRLDFLLPSADLHVTGCGVFWPAPGQPGENLIDISDHRLVWLDFEL